MKQFLWKAIQNIAWLALILSLSVLYLNTIPDSVLDVMSPTFFVVIGAILGGLVFTPVNNLSQLGWQALTTYFKNQEIRRERNRWEDSGKRSSVSDSTLYALWRHRIRNESIWRVMRKYVLGTVLGAIALTVISVISYLVILFISGDLIQNLVLANLLGLILGAFVLGFIVSGVLIFVMIMLEKAAAHN